MSNQRQQQQFASCSTSTNAVQASPIPSNTISNNLTVVDENVVVRDYLPPGTFSSPRKIEENRNHIHSGHGDSFIGNKRVQWVRNPADGSVLKDHNGMPLSVDRLLATNPLRHELCTRPGPGNKKLTYMSGEGVSRTLNDVFGFDGWDLDIKDVTRVDCSKDPKSGKHTAVYTARVRLTHKMSGTFKEDCGVGDSTDRSFATAISHALKASITDAMKRAARHFGDKLGNSLYQGKFSINKAPVSLKDALDKYDIHRSNTKFGFQQNNSSNAIAATTATNAVAPATMARTIVAAPTKLPPVTTTSMPMGPPQSLSQQNVQQQHGVNTSVPNMPTIIKGKYDKKNLVQYQHHAQQSQQHHHSHHQQTQNQSSGMNVDVQNYSGSLNTHRQQQQQQQQQVTMNPVIPPSNGITQPRTSDAISSTSIVMASSTIARPTSSYGRRPTTGSNNAGNATTSSNSSRSMTLSATAPTTTTAGPPSDLGNNSNYYTTATSSSSNNNINNNGRRVSLTQNHHHHQPIPQPPPNSNNINTNVHTVVGQISSSNVGGASSNSSNGNNYNKRPPLGRIQSNSSASTTGGDIIFESSKRPKQQHHNPYNNRNQQSNAGGGRSCSGRKSI